MVRANHTTLLEDNSLQSGYETTLNLDSISYGSGISRLKHRIEAP